MSHRVIDVATRAFRRPQSATANVVEGNFTVSGDGGHLDQPRVSSRTVNAHACKCQGAEPSAKPKGVRRDHPRSFAERINVAVVDLYYVGTRTSTVGKAPSVLPAEDGGLGSRLPGCQVGVRHLAADDRPRQERATCELPADFSGLERRPRCTRNMQRRRAQRGGWHASPVRSSTGRDSCAGRHWLRRAQNGDRVGCSRPQESRLIYWSPEVAGGLTPRARLRYISPVGFSSDGRIALNSLGYLRTLARQNWDGFCGFRTVRPGRLLRCRPLGVSPHQPRCRDADGLLDSRSGGKLGGS